MQVSGGAGGAGRPPPRLITHRGPAVQGRCHPDDGCASDVPYQGPDFAHLAANVTERGSTTPLFKGYTRS
ncbi:hypothetical protein ACN9M0_34470 [Streptomyces sp. R-07]|uniref:hypothetical protein n=1 Tax=Streptomyces sp. R-07 TaxID=3404052 RepID=UPI003CF5E754